MIDHDFVTTLIALVDALAAGDPRCARFGAATHRWRRRPALDPARVLALEAEAGIELPADYRIYLTAVGDGGAGPYHGVLPLDHPAQRALLAGPCPLSATPAPQQLDPWRGVVALADVGCGQAALLVVDGPARGMVWADARAVGAGVVPLAESFTDFLGAGLTAAAAGELAPAFAPAERCVLPRLLSGLLAREEERLGREPGSLAGVELRAVLETLAAGSIAIASTGHTPVHHRGEPIAPCIQCAVLVGNLVAQGLRADVLAPFAAPRAETPADAKSMLIPKLLQ